MFLNKFFNIKGLIRRKPARRECLEETPPEGHSRECLEETRREPYGAPRRKYLKETPQKVTSQRNNQPESSQFLTLQT